MNEIHYRLWNSSLNKFADKEKADYTSEERETNLPYHRLACASNSGMVLELGTGVLDKNGKEIFEGDIVKCITGGAEFTSEVEPIHGGAFWLRGKMKDDKINPNGMVSFPMLQTASDELQILGNIHENPLKP